jgi:hypothetical protein
MTGIPFARTAHLEAGMLLAQASILGNEEKMFWKVFDAVQKVFLILPN